VVLRWLLRIGALLNEQQGHANHHSGPAVSLFSQYGYHVHNAALRQCYSSALLHVCSMKADHANHSFQLCIFDLAVQLSCTQICCVL
jgi:hypothetical protein